MGLVWNAEQHFCTLDTAFSLFIYIFFLWGGEGLKWYHHIVIIHGDSDNNSRDLGKSLHWKKHQWKSRSQEVSAWLPWYCLSPFLTGVLGKEVAANIINLYLVLALSYQDASDT